MAHRRILTLGTAAVTLAVGLAALAGCSSGGSATDTTVGQATAAPTTEATTPAAGTNTTTTMNTATITTAGPATTEVPAATTAPATSEPTTASGLGDRPRTVGDILAMSRPVVLAHTGGEDAYPGSTMFGFAQSVDDGVDVLDLNVVLSSDGVLMVQHDETVDRTTNGSGEVADMTVDELKALDNAYWFTADCGVCTDQPDDAYLYRGVRTGDVAPPDGYSADDFSIPTFRELVERYPDYPLNIEIKQTDVAGRAAADVLANDLADLDRGDATIVTSFDDAIVDYFHLIAPDIELSPGLGATTAWVLEGTPLPHGMRILQLPPEYQDVEVITPERIDAATDAGYPIWIWPNNRELENEASYLSFLQMGITGLNINFPAQGVAAVEEFITASAAGGE